MVERLNRFVKEKIRLSGDAVADWDKNAVAVESDINNHCHKITKFTPNELVRPDMIYDTDMISGDTFWLTQKSGIVKDDLQVNRQSEKLSVAYQRIEKEKMERFSKSRPISKRELWTPLVGQNVYLKLYGAEKAGPKVQNRMSYKGPYKISQLITGEARVANKEGDISVEKVVVAVILSDPNSTRKTFRHANISDIKPYEERVESSSTVVDSWSNVLPKAEATDIIKSTNDPCWDEIEIIRDKFSNMKRVSKVNAVKYYDMKNELILHDVKFNYWDKSWRIRNNIISIQCNCDLQLDKDMHWRGPLWFSDTAINFPECKLLIGPWLKNDMTKTNSSLYTICYLTSHEKVYEGIKYIGHRAMEENSVFDGSEMIWIPEQQVQIIETYKRSRSKVDIDDNFDDLDLYINSDVISDLSSCIELQQTAIKEELIMVSDEQECNESIIPIVIASLNNGTSQNNSESTKIEPDNVILKSACRNEIKNTQFEQKLQTEKVIEHKLVEPGDWMSDEKFKFIPELQHLPVEKSDPATMNTWTLIDKLVMDYEINVWNNEIANYGDQTGLKRKFDLDQGTSYLSCENISDDQEALYFSCESNSDDQVFEIVVENTQSTSIARLTNRDIYGRPKIVKRTGSPGCRKSSHETSVKDSPFETSGQKTVLESSNKHKKSGFKRFSKGISGNARTSTPHKKSDRLAADNDRNFSERYSRRQRKTTVKFDWQKEQDNEKNAKDVRNNDVDKEL